jgi:hypothetical protein
MWYWINIFRKTFVTSHSLHYSSNRLHDERSICLHRYRHNSRTPPRVRNVGPEDELRVVAMPVSLQLCSTAWHVTHVGLTITSSPPEISRIAQISWAAKLRTSGTCLQHYFIITYDWTIPLTSHGARFISVKTRGAVWDVPNVVCGRTEIAMAGTGFGLDIADITTGQAGWIDGNVNVGADGIHAFVSTVLGAKMDVEE